jgi:mRNA deadenylase 3'-5' endonuclease subunit Ccr4
MSAVPQVPVREFTSVGGLSGTPGHRRLSVFQFNTLADALSDAFPHVSTQELLGWAHRQRLFPQIFQQADRPYDFVTLEEVDHFADFFAPLLREQGYDGIFAQRRANAVVSDEGIPGPALISLDGTALFWNAAHWELLSHVHLKRAHKTFGLLACFRSRQWTEVLIHVGAVHLTAKVGFEAERSQEIDILAQALAERNAANDAVIIGGDFNDTPDSIVCEKMRGLHFASAYAHPSDAWTTFKRRDSLVKRVIDYIWYRPGHTALQATDVLEIPSESTFPCALPDIHFPSDHINIAARFAF